MEFCMGEYPEGSEDEYPKTWVEDPAEETKEDTAQEPAKPEDHQTKKSHRQEKRAYGWQSKKSFEKLSPETKALIDSRIRNAQAHWGIESLAEVFPEHTRPLKRVPGSNTRLVRPCCVENDPRRWSYKVLELVEELAECSKADLPTALECLEAEAKDLEGHESGKFKNLEPSLLQNTIHHYKHTNPKNAANWTVIRGEVSLIKSIETPDTSCR
ncbi:hypothetical protein BU16DRAFT_40820 [Lophium mytilinum]|uniref:Uncharacterized protein n=1 Tax=Lophium mytilinum TaxID=390894 RepID=A0A6A6QQM5_9PEZI|nr:hypothetical protein BU16DRAFT_40820 [Lophium mytilinum]